MVAPRAIAPDPAGDLVARVTAALAQLVAERAELAGRRVEGAAVLGRAGLDRPAQVGGVAARECRPARPMSASVWASLLPTWASPWSSAKRTTRRCHGLPRLVGLNVSRASGWAAGSGSSRSRRSTQPWAQSGYGTSGWAGMARPPASWMARIVVRNER